ncbi:fasciclin domain-containing protein [Wenyingzhuangia sp. IMCC45467]
MAILTVVSCSDPWDDRSEIKDQNLSENLTERISKTSETSEFSKLLKETGMDKTLSSSKTYTVWAPTNEAINQVDPSLLSDMESKTLFVQNHIALTAFSTVSEMDTVNVQMLSNKYFDFLENGTVINDSGVLKADQYASNGLLHVIDKAIIPRKNIWQYIKSLKGSNKMADYLLSLDEFNIYHRPDSIAKSRDSIANIAPLTGIYSDSLSNSYLKNVFNLNNERNKYTFFLLEDAAFDAEVAKLEPYQTKGTADSTAIYASYFNVRDLAFYKAVAKEKLPTILTSQFEVEVPINIANISETINLSNGVVHVMSAIDIPLTTRLRPIKVEGEFYNTIFPRPSNESIFTREKEDLIGEPFIDFMIQNHGIPELTIVYTANDLHTTEYKVYWRAINDIQTNTFQQKLRIGGNLEVDDQGELSIQGDFVDVPYADVAPNVYDEVEVGTFELISATSGSVNVSLISANTGTNGNNTLTLDYLKLVPVIK